MSIQEKLIELKSTLPETVTLIAVTKTYSVDIIQEAYAAGHRIFGENKVQELCEKEEKLPKDIDWHLIGHLQTNKVKFIAPFIKLIHSIDSLKLLMEVNKQALKQNRTIDCLLQIFIASEETKFGLDMQEAETLLNNPEFIQLRNIRIVGLMGMASNTTAQEQVRNEFHSLGMFYQKLKENVSAHNVALSVLSMGMSSDYRMAIEQGSTHIRVGSAIFGKR